jgi:hypothetical protein
LRIKVVAAANVDRRFLATCLTDSVHRVTDTAFEIEVEFPEDIPALPSGKRRYVYRTWRPDVSA